MLMLDSRRSRDCVSGLQAVRIVNPGLKRLALEDYIAFTFERIIRAGMLRTRRRNLPGGKRRRPGDRADYGYSQADKRRLELFGGHAIFAQMGLVEACSDHVERISDRVRNRREHLIALTYVAHLGAALGPHGRQRDALSRQQRASIFFKFSITALDLLRIGLGQRSVKETLDIVAEVHLGRSVGRRDSSVRRNDDARNTQRARDPAGVHRTRTAEAGEREIARVTAAVG